MPVELMLLTWLPCEIFEYNDIPRALTYFRPHEKASSQIKHFNIGLNIRGSEELKLGIVYGKIPSKF